MNQVRRLTTPAVPSVSRTIVARRGASAKARIRPFLFRCNMCRAADCDRRSTTPNHSQGIHLKRFFASRGPPVTIPQACPTSRFSRSTTTQ